MKLPAYPCSCTSKSKSEGGEQEYAESEHKWSGILGRIMRVPVVVVVVDRPQILFRMTRPLDEGF